MAVNSNQSGWVGWAAFAGVFLVLAGILQGFEGLIALLNHKFFLVTQNGLAVLNFTAWGWIHLVMGVIILAAGFAILNGSVWGRAVGVVLAALSFVVNMMFIDAYPVWSVIVMLVDALVIYALVVHGDELRVRA